MKRWKITVEYEGSGFCGWQRQGHDPRSVQQTLEEAVEKFSGESVTLHVAGRTDAGVHAYANVAHFDLQKETSSDTIRDAINFYVRPHQVSVLKVEEVSNDFHARFDALGRSYVYRVLNRRAPSALYPFQVWHIAKSLSVENMQSAASLLIGQHDFSTFRAQNCQAKSPVKTLDRLEVTRSGEIIEFLVDARSFLYHQVRNMVGTLSLVGSGQWTLEDFKSAFVACDRKAGGPTAPAEGLFFRQVIYPDKSR